MKGVNIRSQAMKLLETRASAPVTVWGIDLGTTNSTVAEITWHPGESELPISRMLELEQPTTAGVYTSPLVPSVVAIKDNNIVWVGEGAKRLRARPQEAGLAVGKNLFFDTKNEMGLRKTYHLAPAGSNQAFKIAAHVLRFLAAEARAATGHKADRIVVTVPASFQLNQRRDTTLAAEMASIELRDHDLLDEPTAALIDYLFTHPEETVIPEQGMATGVVFDFGGGTCDVAVVEIQCEPETDRFTISPLSVSRYHRLGGGDIDAAIVHEHLIPMLLEENGLSRHDLTWADKKKRLEPELLGTAEALKIALCREIDRLQKFKKYAGADKSEVVARQPGLQCVVGKRAFSISQPSLTAKQFEAILEPFLDADQLYARETEYRLSQSVFAPLSDALHRGTIDPRAVDFCLLVGGSTLIPQLRDALTGYFTGARLIQYRDSLDSQVAVARGAAWHALFLQVTGKPLVQAVAQDAIALLTAGGKPFTLVPAASALPYPADGSFARADVFRIPDNDTTELRMEVIAVSSGQPLLTQVWRLREATHSGDRIVVEYRLTATQVFECRAYLERYPLSLFEVSVENPLYSVLNPNEIRLKIEALEEELRQRGGGAAGDSDSYTQLARWYRELNQTEKAVAMLRTAQQLRGTPDAYILMLQGLYLGEIGDQQRQEKMYRDADRYAGNWGAPMFNLSIALENQKRYAEALEACDAALAKEKLNGPYLTQRGDLLRRLAKEADARRSYELARESFDPLPSLQDWSLYWFERCAVELSDTGMRNMLDEERKSRKSPKGSMLVDRTTALPGLASDSEGCR